MPLDEIIKLLDSNEQNISETELVRLLEKEEEIDLSGMSDSDILIHASIKTLKTNTTLRSLNLANCSLKAEGINSLANALAGNTTLKYLNILGDQCEDQNALIHLLNVIKTNRSLTTFRAEGTCHDKRLPAFTALVESNTTLRELDFYMDSRNCTAILKALEKNKGLKYAMFMVDIYLDDFLLNYTGHQEYDDGDIPDFDIDIYSDPTAGSYPCIVNTNLLSNNFITMLRNNRGLTSIKIHSPTRKLVFDLGKELEKNTTLISITIEDFHFGSEQADINLLALYTKSIEVNTSLTELALAVHKMPLEILCSLNRNLVFVILKSLDSMLQGNIYYQSSNPGEKYSLTDPSKRPYFRVGYLHALLSERINLIKPSYSKESAKFRNEIHNCELSYVALFHLQCIDPVHDNSPIQQIIHQVKASENCLMQISDRQSNYYKITCYRIGHYYYLRAVKFHAIENHSHDAQVFAKSALNFWAVCFNDVEFMEAFYVSVILDLRHCLIHILNPDSSSNVLTEITDNTAIISIAGEKSPGDIQSLNAELIIKDLDKTLRIGTIFSLILLFQKIVSGLMDQYQSENYMLGDSESDFELKEKNSTRSAIYYPSSSTKRQKLCFFQRESNELPAIETIIEALNQLAGVILYPSRYGNIDLESHIIVLKSTFIYNTINQYIADGHLHPILDEEITSLDGLVENHNSKFNL